MKTKLLNLILLAILFSKSVFADDLIGNRYLIKRVLKPDDKIAFLFCDKQFVPQRCEYVGNTDGYSVSDLEELSHSELIEARWKTGGAVIIGLIGAFTGLAIGLLLPTVTTYSASAAPLSVWLNAAGLTAAGGGVPFYFNKINPIHQFNQANVLKSKGIYDDLVLKIEDEKIIDIVNLMKEVFE